jgi:hypothetical protein
MQVSMKGNFLLQCYSAGIFIRQEDLSHLVQEELISLFILNAPKTTWVVSYINITLCSQRENSDNACGLAAVVNITTSWGINTGSNINNFFFFSRQRMPIIYGLLICRFSSLLFPFMLVRIYVLLLCCFKSTYVFCLISSFGGKSVSRDFLHILTEFWSVGSTQTHSVRTSKKTQHFFITKISWLILCREIIVVYSENHTKSINTLCGKMPNYWLLEHLVRIVTTGL